MYSTLSPREWYDLNRFTLQLGNFEPPVLSLYLPYYEVADGSRILHEDGNSGPAGLEEVKEAVARILDRARHHTGSLCIFGWSAKQQPVVKHVRITKEVPPVYVVHRKPYLKPLKDILEIGYQIVVLIMDHNRAKIEVYNGSELVEEIGVKSYVTARHSKGGWSQKRFQQNRELQIRYFFNKVNQQLKSLEEDNIELILLGGIGLARQKFLTTMGDNLAKKTHLVDRVSFGTPKSEISRFVISTLDKARKTTELKLLEDLATPAKHGLVITRNKVIERKLKEAAVEKLFLSADYYTTSPDENSLIRRAIGMAKRKGSTIEFMTGATARKRLHKFGNLVALLRYKS